MICGSVYGAEPNSMTDVFRQVTTSKDDWFKVVSNIAQLSSREVQELHENGFTVVPDVVSSENLTRIAKAYDAALDSACADDKRISRSTTRVTDLVNKGDGAFDAVYIYP